MQHRPQPSGFARHWSLDETVTYLNHGSFGACPREVLAAQQTLRDQMEREAVRFFVEEFSGLMDAARRAVAEFVGAKWEDMAPIANATTAVATVIDNATRGMGAGGRPMVGAGDEVLVNEHEYPACRNNINAHAARVGSGVVNVALPFPLARNAAEAERQVIDAVLSRVTAKTKLALLSHVTSPTGLVLPMAALVGELERRGVATLVDGAHAPGMVPVDLTSLGASFYTANCHKWICSPKGSAFLHVRPDRRADCVGGFRPLVLSNNAESPRAGRDLFLTEFEYAGTADYTAFMAIPAAIRTMGAMLPGGWPEVLKRNHETCLRGRDSICAALGVEPPAPDAMIGSISTIILPPAPGHVSKERIRALAARSSRYHDALQDALLTKWKIQVPIWGLAGKPGRFVRISAQLYNAPEQYEFLAGALKQELQAEWAG